MKHILRRFMVFFWPTAVSVEESSAANKNAFWLVIFLLVMVPVSTAVKTPAPINGQDLIFILFDVVLLSAIAFGVRKRSRIAALAALAYYLVSFWIPWFSKPSGAIVMGIIITGGLLGGVRGTFNLCRLKSRELF